MSQSIHRRNFIKYCGSMAATVAAANVVSVEAETPSANDAPPLAKQETNQDDFVFWRFHSTEQLPLGGRIIQISDITFRIRRMLYPVAMGDVDDFRWDYGGPPTGREETTTFGVHQFYLTDDPITIRISRANGILFQAVVKEIRRKASKTVMRIEAGPETRFYGLGFGCEVVRLSDLCGGNPCRGTGDEILTLVALTIETSLPKNWILGPMPVNRYRSACTRTIPSGRPYSVPRAASTISRASSMIRCRCVSSRKLSA
jgi:hypothetical protein